MNPPGSIDKPTDTRGSVVQSTSFDTWGRRRNPSSWTYSNIPVTLFSREYTGHSLPRFLGEHLDDFGLINMNGRVYDPLLGRFLSPDNYVQMPYGTQGFNRFGYCYNNPLIHTDPSGESVILALGMIIWFTGHIVSDIGHDYNNKFLSYLGFGMQLGGGLMTGNALYYIGGIPAVAGSGFMGAVSDGWNGGSAGLGFVKGAGFAAVPLGLKEAGNWGWRTHESFRLRNSGRLIKLGEGKLKHLWYNLTANAPNLRSFAETGMKAMPGIYSGWQSVSSWGGGPGYKPANLGADDALDQMACSLSYAYRFGDGMAIDDIFDFSNASRYLRKDFDMGGGYSWTGNIGAAKIDIYNGDGVTFSGIRYFAYGGKSMTQNYLRFGSYNLVQSNFPITDIYGKNVAQPFALQITGYFGNRRSVVGTIRFSSWDAFSSFSNKII